MADTLLLEAHMNKLYKNITKFHKQYNIATPFGSKFTKADMYNLDSLMSTYEAIWESLEYYDTDDEDYKFLITLYGELRDYMDCIPNRSTRNYGRFIEIGAIALTIAISLVIGYFVGRYHTIHQAEIVDITDTEYFIDFGGEIHKYSHDTTITKVEYTESGTLYTFADGSGYYVELPIITKTEHTDYGVLYTFKDGTGYFKEVNK